MCFHRPQCWNKRVLKNPKAVWTIMQTKHNKGRLRFHQPASKMDVFFLSRNLKRYHFFHPSRLSASRTSTCGRALRLRKVKWAKETVTRTMRSVSSMARMRKLFPLSTNVVLTGVTLARMVSSSDGSDDGTQLQFFKT